MASTGGSRPPTGSTGKEVIFHIEVCGASGLPKSEVTLLRLSGFGIQDGGRSSLPLQEPSEEPSGWLFEDAEAEAARAKAEAEAAVAAPKAKAKGKAAAAQSAAAAEPPPPRQPPEPLLRLAQPCGGSEDRQRLLDAVCTPLQVQLLRGGANPQQVLGVASLELQALIHDTATVEVDATLTWSTELLDELRQEAAEAAQAAAEAAAAAAAEAAEAAGEPPPEEVAGDAAALPPFTEPSPGLLRARVSTAGPIGRALCPEDLHDWAILTVQLQGCFCLPDSLMGAGGPLPEGASGVIAEHPLRYSLRLLDCCFSGGQLRIPEVEVPEADPADAEGAGVPPDGGEAGETRPGDEDAAPKDKVLTLSFEVGKDEFVEGLMRAGFVAANEDGPAVFDFLQRPATGCGGRLGASNFARLMDVAVPAEFRQLREFCDFLREKNGQLDEAFGILDEAAEGSLTPEDFSTGLERMGHTGRPEDVQALFAALDTQGVGVVAREDLRTLGLHRKMGDFESIDKVKRWLLECCGSVEDLTKQVDEERTGSIAQTGWKAAMERLKCPYLQEAELLYQLLDTEQAGSIPPSALDALLDFDAVTVAKALPRLEALLFPGAGEGEAAIARLLDDENAGTRTITAGEFSAGCRRLGYNMQLDPFVFFTLLDECSAGCISASELSLLSRYNSATKQRRLAACRSFIEDTFGSTDVAFQAMYDDRSEVFNDAEATKPLIEWPSVTVMAYRGRDWLQRLFNTLQDDRGRNCKGDDEVANGGCWLYFYPRPTGQSQLIDFKEITDSTQAGLTRISRWHHGRAFVDLRRLLADPASPGRGPELEFRAGLTEVGNRPLDANESGEMPKSPFGAAQTYVKGTIRLDRPLVRLCPRDIFPLPELDGKPFVPPPPDKPPLPSVSEELELDARRIVGKLACEFARMCHERGHVETQVGKVTQHTLLGRKGVRLHSFLQWLNEQDDGAVYKDLSAELRPAIVRLVRAEAKDGPSCGLSGNDNDARYSTIRDLILKHLFIALNSDVNLNRRKQDACLWMSPALQGEAHSRSPDFGRPAELAEQEREQDLTLQRLIFEFECLGDYAHTKELYEQLLALPHNVESGSVWFTYARFLMRCGQQQLEAEKALRYAMSLRPPEQGPSIEEVAFLSCILQNHDSPCSLDAVEDGRRLRFEAAISILATYADRHPAERMPLYLLFVVYASEAWTLAARMQAAAAAAGDGGPLADSEAAEQALLMAEATKYLEMANATPHIFNGTLTPFNAGGEPLFPELEVLMRSEQRNRKELAEVPPRPKSPAAWQPPAQPVFPDTAAAHLEPEAADLAALEVVDLMLHVGTPGLIRFLITNASYAYGFLSPATVSSERCRLQLVRAAMLAHDWAEAMSLIAELFSTSDRLQEAHALLGECRYRAAREAHEAPTAADYGPALSAFEEALSFITEPETEPPKDDPVLHLRVASIYYLRAEETSFLDDDSLARALAHYRRALLVAPTTEAWRSSGICALRRARLLPRQRDGSEDDQARQSLLQQALRYLTEANNMDRCRPQVNAWLVICAIELGQVQVARQTFRQVMRYQDRLEPSTMLELAEVLLRFSDERLPDVLEEERGVFVQDGRYAQEALAVSRALLARGAGGLARHALARAQVLTGEDDQAVAELCQAIRELPPEHPRRREVASCARACASRLLGEPMWALRVEEAINTDAEGYDAEG